MSRTRAALSCSSLALALALLFACNLACRSEPTPRYGEPMAAPLAAPAPAAPARETPPKSDVERVIELGKSDNRVQQHLQHLCEVIGPRLTGSTRLQLACEWTRDQFQSYGLTASLERWGEFAVGFDRGPWHGGMVAPEKLDFEFHTMAWSPGTDGPKRGPALAYPTSEAELEALRPRIAGAWLVRPPAAELKNEAGEVVFAKPTQPPSELVKTVQGLIVELGGLGEVRGSRSDLLVTDGNSRITWDERPKLCSVRVRRDHHEELWARMQKADAAAPVELEFDVDNRFVQGPVPQYNVVADLVGSQKPDEYVIVCGHLDSWDGAQGTVDNGTGCATTLEAARLLAAAGARPARTIRFILWTGEEQGLFGSEAYVKLHGGELPRISAVFNHDEGTNYLSGLSVTPAMLPAMKAVTAPITTLNPAFPFELAEVDGLQNTGDSDHAPFLTAGVPAFFWKQSGRSDYEHHHHTQYDTFDAAIPEYQEHSALVAAIAALQTADLPELLDRTNIKAPEPRRMGVQLDGTKITEVTEESRAKAVGLLPGDVILSIDGEETKNQASVSGALRKGGSVKVVQVKRGEETLSVTLDWSQDPDEPRRLQQIAEREARDAARKAEREAKEAQKEAHAAEGAAKP